MKVITRRYNTSSLAKQLKKQGNDLINFDNITVADKAPDNWRDFEKVALPDLQEERIKLVLKLAGFGHKVWYRLSTVGGRAKLYIDTRTDTYQTI